MGKGREISVPVLPVPSSCQVCPPLWSVVPQLRPKLLQKGVARPLPAVFWVPGRHWHWEPGLGPA